MQKTDSLVQFINMIVKSPGLFLVNNIEDLGLAVFGFVEGARICSDVTDLNEFMQNFRRFTNEYFETEADYDWAGLIRFHCSGDKGSLELFKQIFDKYVAGR